MKLKRRSVLKGMLASSVGISALKMPALAKPAPFKIGLLTVKTGPLTGGGVQMEQGIMALLKEPNYLWLDIRSNSSQRIPAAIPPAH